MGAAAVIQELVEKRAEYLEMCNDEEAAVVLMISLAHLLHQAREEIDYYKKLLERKA